MSEEGYLHKLQYISKVSYHLIIEIKIVNIFNDISKYFWINLRRKFFFKFLNLNRHRKMIEKKYTTY